MCIPEWQNNWQGGKLSNLLTRVGKDNGYIVQVRGWDCKTGRPTPGSFKNCVGMTPDRLIPKRAATTTNNNTDTGSPAQRARLPHLKQHRLKHTRQKPYVSLTPILVPCH
jgi:hypothetical protein